MLSTSYRLRSWAETALSLVMLLFLLVYTAAYFRSPYSGFELDTSGRITAVLVPGQTVPRLQADDQLIQVGSVTWTDFKQKQQPLFAPSAPGQTVVVRVDRDGQTLDVPWVMPALSLEAIRGRAVNIWLAAFVFWLAGTITLLGLRPRDARWRLLVAFNFLTAICFMAGTLSSSRLLESGIILRAAIWLSLPVYLHLHWIFPRPLGQLPRLVLILGYLAGIVLASLEFTGRAPANAYIGGFVITVLGSLVLLAVHYASRAGDRPDLRLLVLGASLAIVPAAVMGVVGLIGGGISSVLGGALLGLPVLPFTYLCVIHRRSFGGLELRVIRTIRFYLFLILLLPLAALASVVAINALALPGAFVSTLVAGLVIAVAVFGFARFQGFVERRLLRIAPSTDRLLANYVERAAASLDQPARIGLIREQVLTTLLVQQSALVQVDAAGQLHALYADNVAVGELPAQRDVAGLLTAAGHFRAVGEAQGPCGWARLVLPLAVDGRVAGFWLLGRRPPDDYYALGEVESLRSLADQTAIALRHIAQTERVRHLYQANINQRETERTRVARELHDDVLSGLGSIMARLDDLLLNDTLSALQVVVERIWQNFSDLRPGVLDHGLWQALAHLADQLGDARPNDLEVRLEIPPSDARYDLQAEQHLYRIVQQACDKALAYAGAHLVRIYGELSPGQVRLTVEDDGWVLLWTRPSAWKST